MVFENLTLFELHLENSRFGPNVGSEEESDSETYEESTASEESSGRSRGRVVGMLLLVALVAMAIRRFRSSGEEMDVEEDSDQITIEHAAEQ